MNKSNKNDKVIIFDTTLRDGEQSPGASMNKEEKVRLAIQLEKLGVDVIEAGFPITSKGDFEAVKKIASVVKNSTVAALARAKEEDIKIAWESVKDAVYPRIHTFHSTSDIHLKYQYNMDRDEALKVSVEMVKLAKSLCDDIEFSPMDATRTDIDYLLDVLEAVTDAGATTLNIPDTVGYILPFEFSEIIKKIKVRIKDRAIISVHCHNDLGLAVSNTIASINEGARQAEVTINGIGERAGNTSLEELVMILKTRANVFNLHTNINSKEIYKTSRLTSSISGIMVQPNKAIVGANAFAHESGIHQDGVLKNPMTYEIMKPETIGLDANKLILGKLSGKHALKEQLKKMGYNLNDDELKNVFEKFKEIADKKKDVSKEDLELLVVESVLRQSTFFKLDEMFISSGTKDTPKAKIKMSIMGQKLEKEATGNGPIDAIFNAISELTEKKPKLLRFSVAALTGGTDAHGEVTVRLQENGVVALGKGSDLDIITASAKAYINGLNRLESLKEVSGHTNGFGKNNFE